MPLLDHFHPPLSEDRSWEAFHAAWAGSLADDLNRRLPERYFADELVTQAGAGVEVDVATMEERGSAAGNGAVTTTATPAVWAPPAPAVTFPAALSDDIEVRVFSTEAGPKLVGAIELVSPRNKDRAESRRAFAIKCASYLTQGIGLIVVDVVTARRANLHNEIVGLFLSAEAARLPPEAGLYAVAYRPVRRQEREEIDQWPAPLAVGSALPVLPLALGADLVLPVDLEAAYTDACQRRRVRVRG
jgi:hypothetical protein